MTATRRRYLTGTARRETADRLKARYEAGATVREIAAETGHSVGGVVYLLHQAGTAMRPSGFQPKHKPAN
ncbi:helix-turn-helix domain-containing protein [Streptomyces sp. NPDC020794]|uniref:helix-turn-helix domain-containing protein n=1 Tax=unclassified Streptomyces TaxID=2593676 RepID=UPI0036EFC27D